MRISKKVIKIIRNDKKMIFEMSEIYKIEGEGVKRKIDRGMVTEDVYDDLKIARYLKTKGYTDEQIFEEWK